MKEEFYDQYYERILTMCESKFGYGDKSVEVAKEMCDSIVRFIKLKIKE